MNIQLLLSKWLNNEITTQELADWYNKNKKDSEAELYLFLEKEWEKEDRADGLHYSPEELQRLIANVLKTEEIKKTPVVRNTVFPGQKHWLKIGKVAAAVLLVISTNVIVWRLYIQQKQTKDKKVATDIVPGTNKAILTLSNGTQGVLDSVGNRVVYQGNTVVKQSVGGKIVYSGNAAASGSGGAVAEAKMEYNTLATPKGG